jgi:hypothetical protein
MPPGGHHQPLNHQLQCRAFGAREETQQSLQHLLIDIVHRLVMDIGHLYLPDACKFDIAPTTTRIEQLVACHD